MSRPERIWVCGQPFTVKWVNEEAGRLHPDDSGTYNVGLTVVSEQVMAIRGVGVGQHQERDTVLHEILHAILKMTAQRDRFQGKDDDNPEEEVVYSMAAALLAVLRQNPDLVAYLTEPLD